MNLIISPLPHIKSKETVLSINAYTVLAMFLLWLWDVQIFGIRHLYVAAAAVIMCMFFEFVAQKFVFKTRIRIFDGHSIVTGLIIAYFLSPAVPFYQVAVGAFFAVFIAKECFGGTGSYVFNPAAVGIAVVLISFPDSVMLSGVHGTGIARPLYDVVALAFYAAGAVLLFTFRVILWHIPVFYYTGIFAASAIAGIPVPGHALNYGNIMAALFIATDYTSSPLYKPGKVLFGLFSGALAVFIASYSIYPEGICFAVLIMNIFVPLIDRYTKPGFFIKNGGK